jgi:hypothetical protein
VACDVDCAGVGVPGCWGPGTLDAELCAGVSRLEGVEDARIVAAAKEIAARLDAQAVVDRAAKAEADRTVTIRPVPDCMTYETALLPVAQGVGVYASPTVTFEPALVWISPLLTALPLPRAAPSPLENVAMVLPPTATAPLPCAVVLSPRVISPMPKLTLWSSVILVVGLKKLLLLARTVLGAKSGWGAKLGRVDRRQPSVRKGLIGIGDERLCLALVAE